MAKLQNDITMTPKELVDFMQETWKSSIKKLTVEELDLKYSSALHNQFQERISSLERDIQTLKSKSIKSGQ